MAMAVTSEITWPRLARAIDTSASLAIMEVRNTFYIFLQLTYVEVGVG